MRRLHLRVSAALLVIAITAGCDSSSNRESGEATPGPPPASIDVTSDAPPEGHFYILLQGAAHAEYDVYQLRFAPRSLTRVTNTGRVSSVAACAQRLVVAAGRAEAGYSDHIEEVRNGSLAPLDGLGQTEGFTPSLNGSCQVAYGWPNRAVGPEPDGELRLWDPERRTVDTLFRTPAGGGIVGSTSWGPAGEIAALTFPPTPTGVSEPTRPAKLIIVRPDRSVVEVDPGITRPGLLAWGRSWMALSDEDQRSTVFLDPTTRQRAALPEWRPLTWSPDGTRLLVIDSATEKRLGIVAESGLTAVRQVAVVNRTIGGAVWLPD